MEKDLNSQLYRLKTSNSINLRDYARAASAMPQGKLKKFFRKQQEQKEIFSKRIDEEIQKFDSANPLQKDYDSLEPVFHEKEISKSSLLDWSRHREERNLTLCRELLQAIPQQEINQLLKEQEIVIKASLKRLQALREDA